MARPLPRTPEQWLEEILLGWKDAGDTKRFARLTRTKLSNADLFHLAPLVCLQFRGRKLTGKEADRVTEGALANYVVNTEKGLKLSPKLAFALCYVAAHLVLGLVDEPTAGEIMGYCEEHLPGPSSSSERASE
jgi:hypothetical protein